MRSEYSVLVCVQETVLLHLPYSQRSLADFFLQCISFLGLLYSSEVFPQHVYKRLLLYFCSQ